MKKFLLLILCTGGQLLIIAQVNPTNTINTKPVINRNLQLSDSIAKAPIRFAVSMSENYGKTKPFSVYQRYNTNSFMVSISPEGITIRKSGLYHFEGFISAEAYDNADKGNGFANPQFTSVLKIGDAAYTIGLKEIMPGTEHFNNNKLDSRHFKFSKSFSMDIYIVAPATLSLSRSFLTFINNESLLSSSGWLTGYYMSE